MRNFKLTLQYEGARYQGWQRQESTDNTIQGKLELLLSKMCGQKIEIQGSGRTDAGVHAMAQIANFHADTDKTTEEILDYMNQYLPEDIVVCAVEEVPERFHSRLNAKGKVYRYQIINSKIPSVFDRRYAYQIEEKLDIEAMRRAADYLEGTHDFQSFTSAKKGKKSTIRTIESIQIEEQGEKLVLTYTGNGFLYHMVRILTGTLIEVGLDKRKPEDMAAILDAKDRKEAGCLVPAKGLTLMQVQYEGENKCKKR
ncbi:MAG: tRNA pseudouridine(38-40) synthase TruA [Lachnospiraceae bacterium]|nr:tRNA pseudouridine(38-40) synthase TruA [Lachnospiraceae bacterium]